MSDEFSRDPWGFPVHGPITRPATKITTGGAPVNAKVDNSTDNSVNKPLPWIVLACILGSMSLMGVIFMPIVIDAKIRGAQATCDLALKTAYTAKDTVDVSLAKAKAQEKANGNR